MFAHVAFETDRVPHAVVVPREAILQDKSGSYVMLVDRSQKARRTPVTTVAEDAQYVGVGGDLRPGQRVVTLSAIPVREGQMVITGGGKRRGGREPGRAGGAR